MGVSGTANILKVPIVGKGFAQGVGIGTGSITGELCVVRSVEDVKEAGEKFTEGSILVVPFANKI